MTAGPCDWPMSGTRGKTALTDLIHGQHSSNSFQGLISDHAPPRIMFALG